MDKTLVDLDNNLMLRSENIEYDGDSLKSKLDNKYVKLYGDITTKDIFKLSDNINNYDEIHIFATENKYGHRYICNIYRINLYSDYVQFIMYAPNSFDNSLKLYQNTIDTTDTNIGIDDKSIRAIYGVKY